MALTRDFFESVKDRLAADGDFRLALLKEAMDSLLEGDAETGKALLRDFINATIGFEALAASVGAPAKSLHRMLGASGNPRADNLLRLLVALQKAERVSAKVQFQGEGSRQSAALAVHEPAATYLEKGAGAAPGRWARQRAAKHRKTRS